MRAKTQIKEFSERSITLRHAIRSSRSGDRIMQLRFVIPKLALILFALSNCTAIQKNLKILNESSAKAIYSSYDLKLAIEEREFDSTYFIQCRVEFRDSPKIGEFQLDSIPIFLIDSVCFGGECMDSSYCTKAFLTKDRMEVDTSFRRRIREGKKYGISSSEYKLQRPDDDLYILGDY